jgi:hypothetical protein
VDSYWWQVGYRGDNSGSKIWNNCCFEVVVFLRLLLVKKQGWALQVNYSTDGKGKHKAMRAILATRRTGDSGYIQLQRACTGVIAIREYAGHWCETMNLLLWLYPVEEDAVDVFTIRDHYD